MELVLNSGFYEMSKEENMETEGGLLVDALAVLGTLAAAYAVYEVCYAVGKGIAHFVENTTPEPEIVRVVAEPIN